MGAGLVVAAIAASVLSTGAAVHQGRQQRRAAKKAQQAQAAQEKRLEEQQEARRTGGVAEGARIDKLRRSASKRREQTQFGAAQTFGQFPTTGRQNLLGGERGALGQ